MPEFDDGVPTGVLGGSSGGLIDVDLNGVGTVSGTFTVAASDPDAGDSLSFSGAAQSDPTHAKVSFSVSETDAQTTVSYTVRVTDSHGLWDEQTYLISVRDSSVDPNSPPELGDGGQQFWYPVLPDGTLQTYTDQQPEAIEPVGYYDGDPPLGTGQNVTISLINPPQHTTSFNLNSANGTFTSITADGFSGDDPFTVQTSDGVGKSGVDTIHKLSVDMGVPEILHNQPTGINLTKAQKQSTGAYVPVNDDDDDANSLPDWADGQFVDGEDDLLPIQVSHMQNVPPGGHYSLSIPANVTVYRCKLTDGDKGPQILHNGEQFPDADVVLWVEGRTQGTGTLTLTWKRTWTDFQGTVRTETVDDSVKINTVEFAGPQDVPGTSTYTYSATGGVSGAGSTWVGGGVGSTMESPNQENPATNTDTAQFKWARGPIIGHAAYQAAPGYIWDMEANVVRVDVKPPPAPLKEFDVGDDVPRDGAVGPDPFTGETLKEVTAQRSNGKPGFNYAANVILTGPDDGRGINKIKVGFIQTIVDVVDLGLYADGSTRVSSLESVGEMNDSQNLPVASYPWVASDILAVGAGHRAQGKNFD